MLALLANVRTQNKTILPVCKNQFAAQTARAHDFRGTCYTRALAVGASLLSKLKIQVYLLATFIPPVGEEIKMGIGTNENEWMLPKALCIFFSAYFKTFVWCAPEKPRDIGPATGNYIIVGAIRVLFGFAKPTVTLVQIANSLFIHIILHKGAVIIP